MNSKDCLSTLLCIGLGTSVATPAGADPQVTVACYYFGQYHPNDPRNEKTKGKGWSEWELLKAAKPRFPGHQQPKVPLWGYEDESDPRVMAKKIDAAADHGIDAFIFDWYHYNDGPFLDRTINEGFLKASNNGRIRFGLMWANHDWIGNLFPYKKGEPQDVLYPGAVTPENFDRICDHVIRDYFSHPSYWKIDGKPYFSYYDLTRLLEGFGSMEATRAGLDRFRAKAKAAGHPGLHLNAVVWGRPNLPGEKVPADPAGLVRGLGFDSVTSYVWIHHAEMPGQVTDYDFMRDRYFEYWNEADATFDVPYIPNVTMGWDPSPRCDQSDPLVPSGYPFTNTIGGNTPERFGKALAMTRDRLLAQASGPRILNINCWNEWTEGSYLEPDTIHGMQYLEAVKQVSGGDPAQARPSGDFSDWPAGCSPAEVGKRVSENIIARKFEFEQGDWKVVIYPEICAWYGALNVAKLSGDDDLRERLIRRFDRFLTPEGAAHISQSDHVDFRVFGVVPLEIHIQTKDTKCLEIGQGLADAQWATPTADGITHEARYWVDDMFMIPALQVQAFRATGDSKYLDRAALAMAAYLDKLQQPNGLFFHAADSPFYWSRGNGWYAAGMAKLLGELPADHPKRARILAGYQAMMSSLLKYQSEGGLWRQLLDEPESWLETSGTGMFTYAMVTGVKRGWLDEKTYGPAAHKAWLALIAELDGDNNLKNVCVGTNKAFQEVGADLDKQLEFYLARPRMTGDLHGQAPILWTAAELLR